MGVTNGGLLGRRVELLRCSWETSGSGAFLFEECFLGCGASGLLRFVEGTRTGLSQRHGDELYFSGIRRSCWAFASRGGRSRSFHSKNDGTHYICCTLCPMQYTHMCVYSYLSITKEIYILYCLYIYIYTHREQRLQHMAMCSPCLVSTFVKLEGSGRALMMCARFVKCRLAAAHDFVHLCSIIYHLCSNLPDFL